MSQKTDIRISDYLVVNGQQSYVAYALRENGKKEAEKYYDDLGKSIQASFMRKFELVADGEQLPAKQFKKLPGTDDLFEFIHYGFERIYCFKDFGGWWLTHGFDKKVRKTPPAQTNRGKKIKEEHGNWNIIKDI